MNSVFEECNTQKAIIKLGVPVMLGQLATLIYNIVDTYFVSLTEMPAQIAAVTLCSPILLIVMSVSSVFGMGGASVIARMLGAQKKADAEKCVNYCFYTLAISGVITLLIGLLLTDPIARLAGADAENIGYTCDYLRWIFLGAPFIILSTGMAHILRSTALIKEAMISILLGNAVNILFDWIFIVLLGMGTAGAAAATSFGYLCATVYLVIVVRLWRTMHPETPVEEAICDNHIGMFAICTESPNGFDYWIAGLYQGGKVPEGLELYTFPESCWAVFSTKGPMPESLQALNTYVWQEWFPNEGKENQADGMATLEVYSAADPRSADYESGIWAR